MEITEIFGNLRKPQEIEDIGWPLKSMQIAEILGNHKHLWKSMDITDLGVYFASQVWPGVFFVPSEGKSTVFFLYNFGNVLKALDEISRKMCFFTISTGQSRKKFFS